MLRKGRAKRKHKLVRFQVEIPQEMLEEMEDLQQLCGMTSKKELLNNALEMFKWGVEQRQQGYVIKSVDASGDSTQLQMPSLEHAARLSQRYPQIVHSASGETHSERAGNEEVHPDGNVAGDSDKK